MQTRNDYIVQCLFLSKLNVCPDHTYSHVLYVYLSQFSSTYILFLVMGNIYICALIFVSIYIPNLYLHIHA
jgi:hypothetical protein